MAMELTKCAISVISTGNWKAKTVKPVLQVWDIRVVETTLIDSTERYRIVLSDGSFYQQGMLATQLNYLVRSQRLKKGSVVQLNEFLTSTIRDRVIIIVICVDVITSDWHIIGEAKQFPSTPLPHANLLRPSPMYMNRKHTVENNEVPRSIVPIAGLNPYRIRWTIKARVIATTELRDYCNAKGVGKVFSFDLVDKTDGCGGEIRATCFNDVAEQLYYQIEVGKVYFVSEGDIKSAQKTYDQLKNDHEIRLNHTSAIWPCLDADN